MVWYPQKEDPQPPKKVVEMQERLKEESKLKKIFNKIFKKHD